MAGELQAHDAILYQGSQGCFAVPRVTRMELFMYYPKRKPMPLRVWRFIQFIIQPVRFSPM